MDWRLLLIGLVPLIVWILSTLFRGVENARVAEANARRADPAVRRAARPGQTELDRFLEEARRRKAKAAPPPLPPAEESALEAPPARPQFDAPRQSGTRADRGPQLEAPQARPQLDAPPAPKPPKPAEQPRYAPPGELAPLVIRVPTTARQVSSTPVVAKLGELLRDRNGLAAALVLSEIFDRPLCEKRPRRR